MYDFDIHPQPGRRIYYWLECAVYLGRHLDGRHILVREQGVKKGEETLGCRGYQVPGLIFCSVIAKRNIRVGIVLISNMN